jgi:hypothetical protein
VVVVAMAAPAALTALKKSNSVLTEAVRARMTLILRADFAGG